MTQFVLAAIWHFIRISEGSHSIWLETLASTFSSLQYVGKYRGKYVTAQLLVFAIYLSPVFIYHNAVIINGIEDNVCNKFPKGDKSIHGFGFPTLIPLLLL
jgi:hypothetical protein